MPALTGTWGCKKKFTSSWPQCWNANWSMHGGRCNSETNLPHNRWYAFTLRWVFMYAGVIVLCLLARFNKQQARLERKGDIVRPWLHKLALAIVLSRWKATTLTDKWNAILNSIRATAWSFYKTMWSLHIEPDQVPLKDRSNPEP